MFCGGKGTARGIVNLDANVWEMIYEGRETNQVSRHSAVVACMANVLLWRSSWSPAVQGIVAFVTDTFFDRSFKDGDRTRLYLGRVARARTQVWLKHDLNF